MLEFGPITPDEQPAAVDFLQRAFGLPANASFVNPARLRWKNFDSRPDWNSRRAYVLRQDGRIVAHGCIYPVTLMFSGREVSSMRIIDWAGSPEVPGSGVLLFRKLAAMTETALAPGGSEQTQQIMPRLGFERRGELNYYARVLRPFRQYRDVGKGWKGLARFVRNSVWAMRRLAPLPPGWTARPLSRLGTLTGSWIASKRTPELMQYLARCPGASLAAFEISNGRGWFVLSRIGNQGRIADLRIGSEDTADWSAAVSLAARTAAQDPRVFELIAAASIDPLRQALERNGFVFRRRDPIFVHDPKRLLNGPLSLSLLDGDEFFLSDPGYPYLT